MPGPNSRPHPSYKRNTSQTIPPGLAARIAGWEATQQSKPSPKSQHHRPGSQKK